MKQIIGTGLLGGLAFAALSLGTDHYADACNGHAQNPPEPCAFVYKADSQELIYVEPVVSVATTQSNCGCGQTLGDLPDGADVVDAGFVGPNGKNTTEFCDKVQSPQTQAAFSYAQPLTKWSSSFFSGVSTAGINGGAGGWAYFVVANISADGFPGKIGLGEIDLDNGNATLNPNHQLIAALDRRACTDCSLMPGTPGCAVVATIADASGGGGPVLTARPAPVCASKEAANLIARERGEDEEGGGCDAGGARGPAVAFLAMIGAVLAFGRGRRRRG